VRRRRSSSKQPSSRPRARRLASARKETRREMGARRGRTLGPRRWSGGATRQPGTHTDYRTTPRHSQSTGRRRPQRHQRSADEESGCASGGRLPPSTRWTLRQRRRPLADAGTPGNPCVQPGDPRGGLPPALPPTHDHRQVQQGDRSPHVA
jgi:hypothetical protein